MNKNKAMIAFSLMIVPYSLNWKKDFGIDPRKRVGATPKVVISLFFASHPTYEMIRSFLAWGIRLRSYFLIQLIHN
tara:strand:- start:697 stop:924 length:228 start_codon:yes stop_codon:yes gene_type:complete